MSKVQIDFGAEGLLAFWNSMTYDERQALVKNLNDFQIAFEYCKTKGFVEADKYNTKIDVLIYNKETQELKEILARIGLKTITLTDAYKENAS
jgi:hypothetical protein